MEYQFPKRISDEEMIRPKQYSKLPRCGSVSTLHFWIYNGLMNSSGTKRIRLPSKKVNGARATTIDAYYWWQDALQT